jgi:hypothetical protein
VSGPVDFHGQHIQAQVAACCHTGQDTFASVGYPGMGPCHWDSIPDSLLHVHALQGLGHNSGRDKKFPLDVGMEDAVGRQSGLGDSYQDSELRNWIVLDMLVRWTALGDGGILVLALLVSTNYPHLTIPRDLEDPS